MQRQFRENVKEKSRKIEAATQIKNARSLEIVICVRFRVRSKPL
jgi:hypothetical protein